MFEVTLDELLDNDWLLVSVVKCCMSSASWTLCVGSGINMDLDPFFRQTWMGSLSLQGRGEQILKDVNVDQEKSSFKISLYGYQGLLFSFAMVLVSLCGWLSWYRAGKAFKRNRGELKVSEGTCCYSGKQSRLLLQKSQFLPNSITSFSLKKYWWCSSSIEKVFLFLKNTVFP